MQFVYKKAEEQKLIDGELDTKEKRMRKQWKRFSTYTLT